jgi:hypothetical protein
MPALILSWSVEPFLHDNSPCFRRLHWIPIGTPSASLVEVQGIWQGCGPVLKKIT